PGIDTADPRDRPGAGEDGFEKCGFSALERAHQRNASCRALWTAGTYQVTSHCRLLIWSSARDWVGDGIVCPVCAFGKMENVVRYEVVLQSLLPSPLVGEGGTAEGRDG
ncbi:hypothetical protein, partial [Tardiphaga sp.]|uniref:hypothetical protein n=1 Tax=Tardiphaga sp. TaxID=1926292 RepID=UPI0025D1435D